MNDFLMHPLGLLAHLHPRDGVRAASGKASKETAGIGPLAGNAEAAVRGLDAKREVF